MLRYLSFGSVKNGVTNGICTRTAAFTGPDANCYIMVTIGMDGRASRTRTG